MSSDTLSTNNNTFAEAESTTTPAASTRTAKPDDDDASCDSESSQPHELFHHEVDKGCIESYFYILNNPGKNVRGLLIDAFQKWLKISDSQVAAIKEVVQKLHTASLLIDDIEDNSKMRRGEPAAHTIFGTPSVINGANYVYFLAMKEVSFGFPCSLVGCSTLFYA